MILDNIAAKMKRLCKRAEKRREKEEKKKRKRRGGAAVAQLFSLFFFFGKAERKIGTGFVTNKP